MLSGKGSKEMTPMKKRKIPERMCTGCREKKPKRELVRIVRSPEQEITVDFTGKKPGRGAYICAKPDCLKKAMKSRGLDRALEVNIRSEIWESLEKALENEAKEREI